MNQREESNELLSIEKYLDRADARAFWDFIVPRILKLSLLLLCEHTEPPVGLIFPLHARNIPARQLDINHLLVVGESLMGWLKENHEFKSLVVGGPFFDYPDDYHLDAFKIGEKDDVLRVIPRRMHPLAMPEERDQAIVRRLLGWLRQQASMSSFDLATHRHGGMASLPVQTYNDFSSNAIFNSLTKMVVQLGGTLPSGEPRWHFSCVMMPKNESIELPLNRRNLLVYAQSGDWPYYVGQSPHHVGQPNVFHYDSTVSVCLRAFLSGHIVYRSHITEDDDTVHFREEEQVKSIVALPLYDEGGLPLAVLYVGSREYDAFTVEDQRVLRLVGKLIEEAFAFSHACQNSGRYLSEILTNPTLTDPFFEQFLSENEFLQNISNQLKDIQSGKKKGRKETMLTLVIVHLQNRSKLSAMYGYQIVRNLSSEIGDRFRGLFNVHDSVNPSVYHLYGSRFCLLVQTDDHESIVSKMRNMWKELSTPYYVKALRTAPSQPIAHGSDLAFTNIRIGAVVVSYPYQMLQALLAQGTSDLSLRMSMLRSLELGLIECESYDKSVLLSRESEKQPFKVEFPQENKK